MDKRHLLGMAVALLTAGAMPAAAVDNAGGADDGGCLCTCVLGDGWMSVDSLIYNTPASGCSSLSNRTCNVEDPSQFNAVRTGRLANCAPRIEMGQSVVPVRPNGGVADPVLGVQGGWSYEVAPQLNGTFGR